MAVTDRPELAPPLATAATEAPDDSREEAHTEEETEEEETAAAAAEEEEEEAEDGDDECRPMTSALILMSSMIGWRVCCTKGSITMFK